MSIRKVLLLTVGLSSFAACGDEGEPIPADLPVCEAGSMRLQGTVGEVTLDLPTASGDGGLDQDDGGGWFRTQQKRASGRKDVTLMDLELRWSDWLVDGKSRPASGTLVLPSTAPQGLAGQQICVGEGTVIGMNASEIRFQLSSLKTGPGCDQPVAGQLRGCWAPRP